MKKIRGCVKWMVVAISAFTALAVIGLCVFAFLYVRQQEQARAQFGPPTVFVSEPDSGASAPAGSYLTVSATALGANPITRAELWVDGELVETQDSDLPEGISPFYAYFDLLVSEGPHLLFVRATNSADIIGQSLPVSIVGGPKAEPGQTFLAVTVKEEQTLEDIASSYDTELETLQELNPDLGGQQPPAGTLVIVPAPPASATPGPTAPPVGSGITSPLDPTAPPVGPGIAPPPPAPPGSSPVPLPDGPPLKVIEPLPVAVDPNFPLAVLLPLLAPAAPSDLQAQVADCMVRLRWNDNATNETRYEVWMAGLTGSPRLIASLHPAKGGAVWFAFPAPRPGDFNVWVEAVNFVGKQPSNIVSVYVGSSCPNTLPAHLQVELLDMTVRGNEDRVYCYVSFEGAPEGRLPADDSAFIRVQAGQGDVAAWAAGSRKLTVPIPADGALEIGGECWGWSGDTLSKMGAFSGMTSANQWTGARLALTGGSYEIGYAATQAGGASGAGLETMYAYEDPTLPSPYNVTMLAKTIPGVPGSTTNLLTWDWTGDKKGLTGFVVLLDGKPYKSIPGPDARAAQVNLPTTCGSQFNWQVAAVAGEAQSHPSAPYVQRTATCPVLVEVQFKELHILCAENYWFHWTCPNCDDIGTWWDLFANDQHRRSYYSNLRRVLTCGTYTMSQIDMNKGDTLVVPISPSNPALHVGSGFYYINPWGERRTFQRTSRTIAMPLEQWKTYKAEFPMEQKANGVWSKLIVGIQALKGGSSP